MASNRREFKYESLEDSRSIVAYLNALADGISRGDLSLASGEKHMMLHPNGLLRFRVVAKRGKHRARLALKVSWRETPPGDEAESEPLQISPGEGEAS